MNYLVTGATGFIGRRLVASLLSAGHGVNYLARKQSASMDTRAAFFAWDHQTEPPLDCTGRLDTVIHLAGEPVAQRWTPEVRRRIRDSRVLSTRALVAAIRKLRYKPAALISASAIGYYGERGDEVLTEDSRPGSGFLSELCVEWEKEALAATNDGVRVAVVRISIVLGKNGGALPKMAEPFRAGLGGTLGDGHQWTSWIQVDDLVRLLEFASVHPEVQGPLNASSPHPVTNRELTREIARVLHRPALFRVPPFVLRLAMGEVARHVLESTRVVPRAAERYGFQFLYPDLAAALPVSLL